jgi:hypothetical protein
LEPELLGHVDGNRKIVCPPALAQCRGQHRGALSWQVLQEDVIDERRDLAARLLRDV